VSAPELATAEAGQVFVFERHVRFDEVDAAQILFFARFFNYAHDAMEAFFGQLPGGYVHLINDRKIGLPAVHVESDFKSPLRFGDVARIEVVVLRIGRSSCSFQHTMSRTRDGASVAVVNHVCAAVDLTTMKSVPLPDDMRALLLRYLCSSERSASKE
jgi:4-hydroxybenzoyl-CoA thioesterase